MKKHLLNIVLLSSISTYAADLVHCPIQNGPLNGESKESRELKQKVCTNPYGEVCYNKDFTKSYRLKVKSTFQKFRDQAMKTVYTKNKEYFLSRGMKSLTRKNYQKTDKGYKETINEFIKNVDKAMESRSKQINSAFKALRKMTQSLVRQQFEGVMTDEQINKQVNMLEKIIPLYSSSEKTILAQVKPYIPNISAAAIKSFSDKYKSKCFRPAYQGTRKTTHLNHFEPVYNSVFLQGKINSVPFRFIILCPSEVLGSGDNGRTAKSIYESIAQTTGHEFGHAIEINIENKSVFDKLNQCLKNQTDKSTLISHNDEHYIEENLADYWSKRLIEKILRKNKNSSAKRKLQFLRKTFAVLCTAHNGDDGHHSPTKLRINHILKSSKTFVNSFNCSVHAPLMFSMNRSNLVYDCGIKGKERIIESVERVSTVD